MCKYNIELKGHDYFYHFDIKKPTRTSLLQKSALKFIRKQYSFDEADRSTLVYKVLWGKVFILAHFQNPPNGYSCRHELKLI